MSSLVLDSSAIIALLNQEPGAERVEEALPYSIVSAVNVAEVLTKAMEAGHTIDSASRSLRTLRLDIVAFDFPQASKCAELRLLTRSSGLSLGDRSCLALAILKGATALTADRNWRQLDVCPIEFIR